MTMNDQQRKATLQFLRSVFAAGPRGDETVGSYVSGVTGPREAQLQEVWSAFSAMCDAHSAPMSFGEIMDQMRERASA